MNYGYYQYGFTHKNIKSYQLFFKIYDKNTNEIYKDMVWHKGKKEKLTKQNVLNNMSYILKDNQELIAWSK